MAVMWCRPFTPLAWRPPHSVGVPLRGLSLAGPTSLTMKTFSPGLIRPSSRRATSSIVRGIVAQPPRLIGKPRVLGALRARWWRPARGTRAARAASPCSPRSPTSASSTIDGDEHQQDPAADSSGRASSASAGRSSSCWSILASARGAERYNKSPQSTTMTDVVLVLSTVPDDERAESLARTLVDERLAACVNLHAPMVSIYRWKGAGRARSRASARHQDHARPRARARGAAQSAPLVRAARVRRRADRRRKRGVSRLGATGNEDLEVREVRGVQGFKRFAAWR